MDLVPHRIAPHRRGEEGFRDYQARVAIGLVRPMLLGLGVLAALVNTILDPGSVEPAGWVRLAVFWVMQLVFWGLLRTNLHSETVALTTFSLDGIVLAATLALGDSPAASATTFVVLIVIVGYFARPRAAVAFSVVTAAVLTVVGPRLSGWDDPAPIPTVAVAVIITGFAMAYVSSRMRASEAQLNELVAAQQDSLERLRQVAQVRDRLIASVSHELRTPLTSTIGSIETLLRDDVRLDEPQQAQLLELARDGGLRLLALVEDLLTLGATRPESLDLAARPEGLASLAREAVRGLDPGAGRSLHVDASTDPPVRVDRMRLLQVVTNLIVNAIHHGAGDILVEVVEQPEGAVLRVVDDGDGVPPQHVDELFLPFARFSTRTDSTGLGLAICRTIVEAHGGSIRYARSEDDHTVFEVRLPLDPQRAKAGRSA